MTGGALSSFLGNLPSILQVLILVGSALVALKLFTTGLYIKYRVFFVYFLFRIPNSLWPLLLQDNHSKKYFFAFISTDPLVLAFCIFLVRELYRLVLEDYRGLQTAGRYAMYASIVGAVAVSILSLLPRIAPSTPQISRFLPYLAAIERGTYSALALFILLLLGLLSRYPIQLRRNVRVQAILYSALFFTSTAVSLARSVFGLSGLDNLNLVNSAIGVGVVFAWLILLSPAGEAVPKRHTGVGAAHEQRLLLQLEGLNTALLRVSRSKIG